MGILFLHFAAGTLGVVAVALVAARLSGAAVFSAPLGSVFIGLACASAAQFISPWATPAIVVVYALFSASEILEDRKTRGP